MRDFSFFGLFYEMKDEFNFEQMTWNGKEEDIRLTQVREGEKSSEIKICGDEHKVNK